MPQNQCRLHVLGTALYPLRIHDRCLYACPQKQYQAPESESEEPKMTRREKEVLNTITQVLENLTTRLAALEGALVRGGTLATGLRQQLESDYVAAAKTELAALRTSISVLPIQGGPAL
jgi:hypothetical protein